MIENIEPRIEISLTEYLGWVSEAIRTVLPIPVWIRAEVSSVNFRGKGYATVGLLDLDKTGTKTADVSALVWSQNLDQVIHRFRRETGESLKPGMKVLVKVSAGLSPIWGFRLTIEAIDTAWTIGESQRKVQAVKDALSLVWMENRNKTAPVDFTRIAVIGPVGAGIEDFLKEAKVLEAHGICAFDAFTCTFEGPAASRSVVAQITGLNTNLYDALFIVRGGGAASSLAWLDDHDIVQAVCLCPIPVFVGIGHERDRVLLDEVAYSSLGTPSKAIGWLLSQFSSRANEMESLWQEALAIADKQCEKMLVECENLKNYGFERVQNLLNAVEQEVESLAREGFGLGPQATFERGYCMAVNQQGKVIRSFEDMANQSQAWLMFENGNIAVKPQPETAFALIKE